MEVPNPGSKEAVKQGCSCPILDNFYGKGIKDGLFWINQGCPLHTMKEIKEPEKEDECQPE